jgi:hypothetical protein
MRFTRPIIVAVVAILVTSAVVAAAVAASSRTSTPTALSMPMSHSMASMPSMRQTSPAAVDLRVKLDNLFAEHAVLAMNATNAGVTGSKSFPAAAKALDNNSVAISKAIASVYGANAGRMFLNGPFMWRAHIKFFVDYTVAVAKHDKAGQARAVANLKTYTVKFGDFLAGATGLPKAAVRNDLLGHVLELKSQLDAFASGKYSKATVLYHNAYNHMFMTADLVAGAIAKQKNLG